MSRFVSQLRTDQAQEEAPSAINPPPPHDSTQRNGQVPFPFLPAACPRAHLGCDCMSIHGWFADDSRIPRQSVLLSLEKLLVSDCPSDQMLQLRQAPRHFTLLTGARLSRCSDPPALESRCCAANRAAKTVVRYLATSSMIASWKHESCCWGGSPKINAQLTNIDKHFQEDCFAACVLAVMQLFLQQSTKSAQLRPGLHVACL